MPLDEWLALGIVTLIISAWAFFVWWKARPRRQIDRELRHLLEDFEDWKSGEREIPRPRGEASERESE